MKNIIVATIFIVLSFTPYGFWVMYWDYEYGSILVYITCYVISLVIGLLARSGLYHKGFLVFPVISYVVSYIFLQMFSDDGWNYFFKPFGAGMYLILFYLMSVLFMSSGYFLGWMIKQVSSTRS
ncbi:hypothetical protein [Alkalicoccobacillus porphyridii]|uniref:Uncharacterized protein n=1 Tax=Alkalicoccobacillus porphyridii TaxID=2597270 RepID=A0A553ZVX0_9BACI|nr:hypothetical protein [Alkalicoccobacillus porphyridii]TSB45624.1 hypothetical protein FN960_15770 [Alkalicoccobacillus porphyridii]